MAADAEKIALIRQHFAPLIGTRILGYHTAEILHEDGVWSDWPDLPIRLFTDSIALVSISWSKFDDLWLSNDDSLPFNTAGSTVRWVENAITATNGCIGQMIHHVFLGRGEFSLGNQDIEIWNVLLIELDNAWLEIFNALDENGYAFHTAKPVGEFVICV